VRNLLSFRPIFDAIATSVLGSRFPHWRALVDEHSATYPITNTARFEVNSEIEHVIQRLSDGTSPLVPFLLAE